MCSTNGHIRLFHLYSMEKIFKKSALLLVWALTTTQVLMAQMPVMRSTNALRHGDVLQKTIVEYVNEGDAGENMVWNFCAISQDSRNNLQAIVSNGDTIAILGKEGIQHFVMRGDTLLYKGMQSRCSLCVCQQERPVIIYPFHYRDSIFSTYSGTGYNEGIEVLTQGRGCTVADGTGVLTDGVDTLTNVTRLSLFDEFIENYSTQVEVKYRRYTFLWFCAGSRYPVMESVKNCLVDENNIETPIDSVSYLYLPAAQSDLAEDTANDSIRYKLNFLRGYLIHQDKGIRGLTSLQTSLSASNRLIVDYTLSESKTIALLVCDVLGNILGYYRSTDDAGNWQADIPLNRKPISDVLLLNIQSGEEQISIKVNRE